MASLTITSITVSGLLCPLVETGKQSRTTYFSNGAFELWKTPDVCRPAASPGTNVSLDVTFEAQGGALLKGASFDITAAWDQYKTAGLDKSKFQNFITPKKATWDRGVPVVNCSILAPTLRDGSQKRLPWAFNDTVEWTISVAGKKTIVATKIELYILPSYIPKFMIDDGIPLGLLRLQSLVPTWMTINDPGENDWPIFAVKAVFSDPRLWYDNFSGASSYCSHGMGYTSASKSVETSCWIELWLSDMNGLSGDVTTKPTTAGHSKFTRYPVNCFDTAALVQTIASLNLQNLNAQARMIFMDKFGYINETLLIGRHHGLVPNPVLDKCNNPFYKLPTSMNIGRLAPERVPFSCHYFVTIDNGTNQGPRVFDACCGPQAGTNTLPLYITAAIDADPKLYSPNKYLGGPKINRSRPNGPGLLSDGYYGPGVVSLATPASFKRTATGQSVQPSLFQRMDEALNFPNDLLPPFEGSPSGGSAVVATWTYTSNFDADTFTSEPLTEAQISIWRHSSAASVKSAYERRRASLTDFTEVSGNDLTYDDTEPGYYMFYWSIASTSNDNNFLIVIEGNMPNSKIASVLVKKLKTEILEPSKPLPDNTTIDVLVAPTMAQKVDTNFTMTLKVCNPILLQLFNC